MYLLLPKCIFRLYWVRLLSPIGDDNNGGYFHRSVILTRATIITECLSVESQIGEPQQVQ